LVHGETVVAKPVSKLEEERLLWSIWKNKSEYVVDRFSRDGPEAFHPSRVLPRSIFSEISLVCLFFIQLFKK